MKTFSFRFDIDSLADIEAGVPKLIELAKELDSLSGLPHLPSFYQGCRICCHRRRERAGGELLPWETLPDNEEEDREKRGHRRECNTWPV